MTEIEKYQIAKDLAIAAIQQGIIKPNASTSIEDRENDCQAYGKNVAAFINTVVKNIVNN